MASNVIAPLRNGNHRGTRPKLSSDRTQAQAIQRLCCKVVLALEPDLESASDAKSRMNVAIAIRSAVQAWDVARDAARIARNKPLPGSLRPESPVKKQRKQPVSTFQEIAPAAPSLPSPSGTESSSKP